MLYKKSDGIIATRFFFVCHLLLISMLLITIKYATYNH